jgi:hypothetical protein
MPMPDVTLFSPYYVNAPMLKSLPPMIKIVTGHNIGQAVDTINSREHMFSRFFYSIFASVHSTYPLIFVDIDLPPEGLLCFKC